jgi:hypothetical protein
MRVRVCLRMAATSGLRGRDDYEGVCPRRPEWTEHRHERRNRRLRYQSREGNWDDASHRGWVDNMFFDSVSKRLYASCGTGYVYVYQQRDPDHYDLVGKTETAVMGKTSLLFPSSIDSLFQSHTSGGCRQKFWSFRSTN